MCGGMCVCGMCVGGGARTFWIGVRDLPSFDKGRKYQTKPDIP